MQGRPFNLEVAVPRTRLGGTGTPAFEVLCFMPMYRYGIPAIWLPESMAAGYKRRTGGRFQADPIDWNDPPIYEAEATYLKHHGLLFPGEEAHLTADSFEPEALCNRHCISRSPPTFEYIMNNGCAFFEFSWNGAIRRSHDDIFQLRNIRARPRAGRDNSPAHIWRKFGVNRLNNRQ